MLPEILESMGQSLSIQTVVVVIAGKIKEGHIVIAITIFCLCFKTRVCQKANREYSTKIISFKTIPVGIIFITPFFKEHNIR
jgi:hypothetical protein